MNILINLKLLQKHGLSANVYCLLFLIYKKHLDFTTYGITTPTPDLLLKLQERGWIRIYSGVPKATAKLEVLIRDHTPDDNIEELVDKFRSKFKGKKVKSMGDKKACRVKMQKFLLEYPEYNNEELILSATERYINSQKPNGYAFLRQADYFIYKRVDGTKDSETSDLAAMCEEVENLKDTTYNNYDAESI